jgi:glyoxylase-like metal-dependent hydrolase (beta-lactamase superfamily II)
MLSSNCYIVGQNGEGVIIDIGISIEKVCDVVNKHGLSIKYIFLTHAHFDHICSVDEARERLNAKVIVHEKDAGALSDRLLNGSLLFGHPVSFKSADIQVKGGEKFEIGGLVFEIIHTPGHSPGGMSIKVNEMVFTGDTLFKYSIGRTDLGNGNLGELLDSIKNRLLVLDDNCIVYPGHGASSTIGFERERNPFLR